MIVKLRRAGALGAKWLLSRQGGSQPEWLEQSDELDDVAPSGIAWVDADLSEGRWLVHRLIVTPLPGEAPTRVSGPRERKFRIVASA